MGIPIVLLKECIGALAPASKRSMKNKLPAVLAVALWFSVPVCINAQVGGGGQPPTAQASAPIDFTGYWVSIVNEDWRFRMLTPAKGDYAGVPLNTGGRKVADTWGPDKDEATGNQCKSYGAAAIMRVPGRIHITWDNDSTLKIETDAGMQTRLLHFGEPQQRTGEATWQGDSIAQWEYAGAARGGQNTGFAGPARGGLPSRGGDLKVVTTHMRPGYLRKNGVPYSGNVVLTEYFHRTVEPNGDSWLIVTTLVEDPQYLNQPFQTSTHFKKQADASGWDPLPCTAR
jgi:hypothetical protein